MKKRLALFLVFALLMSMLPTTSLAVEKVAPETTSVAQSTEEQPEAAVSGEETADIEEAVGTLDSTAVGSGENLSVAEQQQDAEAGASGVTEDDAEPDGQPELDTTEGDSAESTLEQAIPAQEETFAQEPSMAGEEDIVASGTCGAQGDNLTWTLDSAGTLTISGSGDMADYPYSGGENVPWDNMKDQIYAVVIESGVTSIGVYAFEGCRNLKDVAIPDSVVRIDEFAFYNCSGLNSISIPDNVTQIKKYAFANCGNLSNIGFPAALKSIGVYAFQRCTALLEIMLPDGLTSIGGAAFEGCTSLQHVTLPQSITRVEGETFSFCSNLQSVDLPEHVNYIGERAFWYCSQLINISIPEDCQLGRDAFNGCTKLIDDNKFIVVNNTLIQYVGTSNVVTIPNGITKIASSAFMWNSVLTSVTIPDSVVSVGDNAFYSCSKLKNVSMSTNIQYIGDSAFYNCANLEVIAIPENCILGDYAFSYCTGMVNDDGWILIGNTIFGYLGSESVVTVPQGTVHISSTAFSWNDTITEIVIPDSVTDINSYIFVRCEKLTAIYVQNGNKVYSSRDGILYDRSETELIQYPCSKSGEVFSVPDGTIEIGDRAFYGNVYLRSIFIPDSVTYIGSNAFDDSKLTSISIGSGLKTLADDAFLAMYLQEINISEENPNFCSQDGVLFSKDGKELIRYPAAKADESYTVGSGVTTIAYVAFESVEHLKSVSLPDSVNSIGGCAFMDSALESITFAGNAPVFEVRGENLSAYAFGYVIATAYYPENNETWTEAVMQDYGGSITWEPYTLGVAVSGTITSWEQDSDAEYLLYDSGWSYAEIRADLALETPQLALSVGTGGAVSSGSGGSYEQTFTFDGVEAGTYKLAICKSAKYVPQVVTVTVGDGNIDLGDLSLQPVGDASGDGTVTIIDAALANSYARGTGELEEYALACADVSGNDGKVTIIDAARINAHARGTASLWE